MNRAWIAALALVGACSAPSDAPRPVPTISASDAFVWGYPLVVAQRTMQTFGRLFGVNRLFNQDVLSSASTRVIVSPNQDTLYSVAVLDLRDEPVVLSVPDVLDRYWVIQLIDAWSSSFGYLGTRATSGKGGTFVIAQKGWTGALPAGAQLIEAPTPRVLLLGRWLVRGAADVANVNALTRKLVPLSVHQGQAPGDPIDLGDPPGTAQEVGKAGGVTFDELADALALDPPASPEDVATLPRFAPIFGVAAHPFEATRGDPGWSAFLDRGVEDGLARIVAAANDSTGARNGWSYRLDIGRGANDPLVRASTAHVLFGANVAAEAIYASSTSDASGAPYAGARGYVVHFGPSELPPVDPTHGFWSITLYGPDRFFVENPLHRYAIGDRTPDLVHGADGSLDVYIAATAPVGHEANWLPAPAGAFVLTMRMYLPQGDALAGTYAIPPVTPR